MKAADQPNPIVAECDIGITSNIKVKTVIRRAIKTKNVIMTFGINILLYSNTITLL